MEEENRPEESLPCLDNERRPGVLGEINFSAHKKRTVRKIIENEVKESGSNSFVVPTLNKTLKASAVEELKNDDNILAVLSLLGAGFALAGNEETFAGYSQESSYVVYLRCAFLICSITSVIWIVRRYQMLLVLKVLSYNISICDTIWSSGLYRQMSLEILVHCIFSPPGFDYYFNVNSLGYQITYSLDDIFTVFALFRLYSILRLFGHHSVYTQKNAQTVCEWNGETANSTFALKSFIKDSPFFGIGVVFISLSVFSAVLLRIAERPSRYYGSVETPSSLTELSDDLWVIFFTTTTVGYGNIVPVTHTGRAICIIACIFGNMFLGMVIVAISQKMDHSDNENLAYAWIYRHYTKDYIKKHALKSVRTAAKLYLLSKRWKCKCVSRIKPNPPVHIGQTQLFFDMRYLTKEQYLKKCQIYRDLKKNLKKVVNAIEDSRNIGQKEIENIKLIEDTVRVDSSMIANKLQKMVDKKILLTNGDTSRYQHDLEKKLLVVKESANKMRNSVQKTMNKSSD